MSSSQVLPEAAHLQYCGSINSPRDLSLYGAEGPPIAAADFTGLGTTLESGACKPSIQDAEAERLQVQGKSQKLLQRKRTIFTQKQLEELNLLFKKNPYPNLRLKKEMALQMNMDPTVLQVWFKNHRAKLKKAKGSSRQEQETPHQQLPEAQPLQPPRDTTNPTPSPNDGNTLPGCHPSNKDTLPVSPSTSNKDTLPVSPSTSNKDTLPVSPSTSDKNTLLGSDSPSDENTDLGSLSSGDQNTLLGSPASIHPTALIYTNKEERPSFQLSVCPMLQDPVDHLGGHKMVHFGCCQDSTIYWLQPILSRSSLESHIHTYTSTPPTSISGQKTEELDTK